MKLQERRLPHWAVGLVVVVLLASGCLDTASLNNDQSASDPTSLVGPLAPADDNPAPTTGDGDPAPSTGDGDPAPSTGDGDPAPSTGDGDPAPSTGDGDPAPSTGDGDVPMGDAGMTTGDGDEPVLMPELVAGTATAAGCLSYTAAAGGMCGSYFCGVNAETLGKALDPNGVCGENNGNMGGVEFVCEGRPVTVVGGCARTVKAANLFLTNEELRPLVKDCVYEDAEIKTNVTEPCLDCFIDVADCAGTMCLLECLAGDSEACDACRMTNNCDQPLFNCAGFPDPL